MVKRCVCASVGNPLRFDDLLRREHRVPERADHPFRFRSVSAPRVLVEVGVPVVPVQLVQVDVVGAEALQARFDGLADPSRGCAALVRSWTSGRAELRRQDDLVAAVADRVADDAFGLAIAVPSAVSMRVSRHRSRCGSSG